MPRRNVTEVTANEQTNLMAKAMAGDIVLSILPATVDRVSTDEAWSREVSIVAKTAAGEIHYWLDKAFATSLAASTDSVAGTASVDSATLTLVKGQATVTVSGDAEAWLEDETNTLTVSDLTIMGYTVTGGTSVETIVAAE